MREPKKPSGYCHNGHDQRKSGFIEASGDWRCRDCRRLANQEKDFWKLVHRLIHNLDDVDALEKLKKFHWRNP